MPSRYAWVVYTLTIPFLIIIVLLINLHGSTNIRQTKHWRNLIGPYNVIEFAWNQRLSEVSPNTVEGRYAVVRRDLGLDEQRILLSPSFDSSASVSNSPPIRSQSLSHRPSIKRALDFILVEEVELSPASSHAGLPLSDDADIAALQLTEDAMWDYSNSKQAILDNFARSALRDEEDAAAATLAKGIRAKMRARAKEKRRKKVANVRKPSSILRVRLK